MAKQKNSSLYGSSLKSRPKIEYLSEYLFRPIAHLFVLLLIRLKISPPTVVLFHTLLGIIAGALISNNNLVFAAILIQLKTILDNADGQLARATDQMSEIGRYLDTEGDFLVNIVLIWGLSTLTGQVFLSIIGLIILTLTLSLDFNLEYLYQKTRNQIFRKEVDISKENKLILGTLKLVYQIFFAWQDWLLRFLSEKRFENISKSFSEDKKHQAKLVYYDEFTLSVLANLELSTQLAVFGLCLILNQPILYLIFLLFCAVILVWLQIRREKLALKILNG